MPLTLITTPGADDANAFADVAEALAVASFRGPVGEVFIALNSDQQAQALATTAADMDTLDYIGTRATTSQSLSWPRLGTVYDGIPPNLKKANIEEAIDKAPLFADGATGSVLNPTVELLKRKKTDVLEREYFAPPTVVATSLDRFARVTQNLLTSLVRSNAPSWGSAVVVRGS